MFSYCLNFSHAIVVECPSLTTPESGSMLLWSNGFNTYANISCADSYSLVGERLITCETIGVWDRDMPICCKHSFIFYLHISLLLFLLLFHVVSSKLISEPRPEIYLTQADCLGHQC